MSIRRVMLLCGILLLFAAEQSVLALQCEELNQDKKDQLKRLYQYALVAELAYGESPTEFCFVLKTKKQIQIPPHKPIPLTSNDVINRWQGIFSEFWVTGTNPSSFGRYIGDDGVTYLTCNYDYFGPQLAITWVQTVDPEGPDDLANVLLSLIIFTAIGERALPRGEELGIVRLTRDPPSRSEREQLVAIRGTDFTRVPQIMASLNDLLANSCVFEMAAIVVAEIGRDDEIYNYAVIGHSLGGAAVQYIVKDHAIHKWRNPMHQVPGQNRNITFGAYAFNSIGLDQASAVQADSATLYSFYVQGEVVSWLGRRSGRRQAGTVIRYHPPDTWPGIVTLRFENWTVRVEPEPIRRHRLPAVKRGICECINGYGAVE